METVDKQPKKGLELLDDEKLAEIVNEAEFDARGDFKTIEASIAFKELARRSGEKI